MAGEPHVPELSDRPGRADLHVHTLASDGTAGVEEMIRAAMERGFDVVAITDHERIDAALAGRAIAQARGLPIEVVVGEEITTRGGHLLGLWLDEPIRPLQSLRDSIAQVHEQGGLAIPAHPLVPLPMCASSGALRTLIESGDPRVRPDALEVFNPTTAGRRWHPRVVRFARQHGLAAIGNSDSHVPSHVGQGWTTFPGRGADDLRAAILAGTTEWGGRFYPASAMFGMLYGQMRKYSRDVRDEVIGRVWRRGTGRDLGYPGGRFRPPRLDEREVSG
jgi:predicted metal-dependent phosphoesterase TrpH